ncbi:MAG: ribosome maturation factor RimP [Alphaproteobacteria bacterium]|jgi:ribosome maturation factor RimP
MKPLEAQVHALIEPSIAAMGFRLVQLKLNDGSKNRLLQIMAERPDGSITLEDCANISRQVSAVLDVEDIIPTAYRLEVGSPGIDRPLVSLQDYINYQGFTAKLETILPIQGRRRFTGEILAPEGETLRIKVDGEIYAIALRDVQQSKLVLTEALMKKAASGR